MEANAESVELCSPIMAHVWLEPSLWPAGVEGARILAPLGRAVDVAPSRVGGMRGERHRQPKRVAEEVQGGEARCESGNGSAMGPDLPIACCSPGEGGVETVQPALQLAGSVMEAPRSPKVSTTEGANAGMV